jgi:DNA-nicking Smr family endonuclease
LVELKKQGSARSSAAPSKSIPEEADWREGVRPLSFTPRVEPERPRPAPVPRQKLADERAILAGELLAPLELEDWLEADESTHFLRPGVPRRVLIDLRRSRWALQGEIDLHGLTRIEARQALSAYLARARRQGLRCIRVIHGKGLRSPGGFSVLRHLSRRWLAQRDEILAFCEAPPARGGSGALIVLLRASRE